MSKTRQVRKRDRIWNAVKWIGGILLAGIIMLLLLGTGEEPEPTSAQERRAQFLAQEEYYRVLDMGMSEWSAEQAAQLKYEEVMGNG